MQFQKFILVLLVLGFAACSQPIQFIQPPTPQTIRIAYLSSLSPLTEFLQLCISEQIDSYFVLEEIRNVPAASQADLTIWLGEKPISPELAFPFGWEKLTVILNPKNSVNDLTVDDIRHLFTGEIDNWQELEGVDRPVSVWIYPEDDELQRQFSQFLDLDRPITSLAYLASSPAVVKEAIASDPGAIGFLPNAWMDADLSPIQLDLEPPILPILALTGTKPDDSVREFIACLQSSTFQAAIQASYQPWNK